MNVEQQIFDEMRALSAQYPEIPKGAKTFDELRATFPGIPKGPLKKWITKKVASGEWLKARRANVMYYWPAHD